MTERVQKWWLGLSAAYVVVVLGLSVATIVSDSSAFVIARLLVCAPVSLVAGPFEILSLYAVSELLGSGTAVVTVATAVDVLFWGMLAALQACIAWSVGAVIRARRSVRPTQA